MDHSAADCQGNAKRKFGEFDEKSEDVTPAKKPYQFLHIWILREYLDYEFGILNPPCDIDFERIVDDFVFICFFVGNDFLPHMPTFEIHEGAINLLMAVYKKEFRAMGGYLTDSCTLNLSTIEHFIQAICSYEVMVFQKRASLHQQREERIKREKAQAKLGDDVDPQPRPDDIVPVAHHKGSCLASASPSQYQQIGRVTTAISGLEIKARQSRDSDTIVRARKVQRISSERDTVCVATVEAENCLEEIHENEEDLKSRLKELLKEKSDMFNSDNQEEDKVKLGEEGWKKRYYEQKFDAKTPEEIEAIQRDAVLKYVEGLCWVMRYYYEGVSSWQWFYPYHYAPFASDLKGLGQLNISFELGSPFKPFNQLMGVFPAASAHALPFHYRQLMLDPNSPIIDFYPSDFEVDMNGNRYAWQGIAKLPFIDEGRLLAEIGKVEHTLTEEEVRRNSVMFDTLFINLCHPLSPYIFSLNNQFGRLPEDERANIKEKVDPIASCGMNGYLSLCNGGPCPPVFRSPIKGMDDIMDSQVICAIYKVPDAHKHIARPPPGVVSPKKTVSADDLKPQHVLWHEDTGRKPMDNGRPNIPGSILGRQLGEAAHQLPKNSLQMQTECNGGERRHAPPPYNVLPTDLYSNGRHHSTDHGANVDNGHLDNGHAKWSSASSNLDSQPVGNGGCGNTQPTENGYSAVNGGAASNHSAPAGRDCSNDQPTENGYSALNGGAALNNQSAPASRDNGNHQPTENGYSATNGGAASNNHSVPAGGGNGNNQPNENGYSALNVRGGRNRRRPILNRSSPAVRALPRSGPAGYALNRSSPSVRDYGKNQPTENGHSAPNGGGHASNDSSSAGRGNGNNQPNENGYSATNGRGGQSRRHLVLNRSSPAVRALNRSGPAGYALNRSSPAVRGYSNNQPMENGYSALNGGGAASNGSATSAGRGYGNNQPMENGYSAPNGGGDASNHSAPADRSYGNNQSNENGYSALNGRGGRNRRGYALKRSSPSVRALNRSSPAVRVYGNNQPTENGHSELNGGGAASNESATPAGRGYGNNQPTENGYSALNGEGGQRRREAASNHSPSAVRGNNQPTENGHSAPNGE